MKTSGKVKKRNREKAAKLKAAFCGSEKRKTKMYYIRRKKGGVKMKKEAICTATGVIMTGITQVFGGWTPSLTALLICMAVDLTTGFIVAAVFQKSTKSETGAADSSAMFKGLCKKFVMICILAIAHQLDIVIGVDYIMAAVTYTFIANEALSIVENAGLMGIVKSETIMNAIETLKKKGEKTEGE